jgi:hypothetical protein
VIDIYLEVNIIGFRKLFYPSVKSKNHYIFYLNFLPEVYVELFTQGLCCISFFLIKYNFSFTLCLTF